MLGIDRAENELCIVCGEMMEITRSDGIPMHSECEKRVIQKRKDQIRNKGKKSDGFFMLRGMRYVPPQQ